MPVMLDKRQEDQVLKDDPTMDSNEQIKPAFVKCSNCGYENPPGQKLCTKCQNLLQLGSTSSTTQLPPSPDQPGVPKWGSTVIEQRLFLHIEGSNEPVEVVLEERDFIIGRRDINTGSLPDIDLTNYQADKKGVSRKHACLSYKGKSMKISDLNSSNHTFLNGYKLVPNQARILRDGDEIRLGKLVITVQFGEGASID